MTAQRKKRAPPLTAKVLRGLSMIASLGRDYMEDGDVEFSKAEFSDADAANLWLQFQISRRTEKEASDEQR